MSQASSLLQNLKNIPCDDKNGLKFRNELCGALAYMTDLKKWARYDKYLSTRALELFKEQIVVKVEKLASLGSI